MIAITDNNVVAQECNMCGCKVHMQLSDEELKIYRAYLRGEYYIQECFPALNRCEHEFLKSGYCAECQELLFNNGYTRRLYQINNHC